MLRHERLCWLIERLCWLQPNRMTLRLMMRRVRQPQPTNRPLRWARMTLRPAAAATPNAATTWPRVEARESMQLYNAD